MTPDRIALIAGLADTGFDWIGTAEGLREDLIAARACVATALAETYRVDRAELLEGPTAFTTPRLLERLQSLAADPPAKALWLLLGGEVVDAWGQPYLVTGDAQPHAPGLPLRALCSMLDGLPSEQLVIALDVGRGATTGDPPPTSGLRRLEAEELDGLPWPACTLWAAGSGLLSRLPAALTSGTRGRRTAGVVVTTLDAAASRARGDDVLNEVSGRTPGTGVDSTRELQVRDYLGKVRRDVALVAFELRSARTGRAPDLRDVYIEPWARDTEADARLTSARRKARIRASTEDGPTTAHTVFARRHQLFVVGEPGSGKTTFVRRLADLACEVRLDGATLPPELPPEPLPLLVNLERYGRTCQRKAVEPCAEHLKRHAFATMVCGEGVEPLDPAIPQAALRSGQLVLLLDGLDEVPTNELRRQVAAAITELARACPALRMVVTCRPAAARSGAALAPPFATTELEPFDDDQRKDFVGRWMRHHHPDEASAAREAERLRADLAANPRLTDAVSNPLLLTTVCVLFHERGRLPDERSRLYHEIIQHLLEDRHRMAWDGPAKDLSIAKRRKAAQSLAWEQRDVAVRRSPRGAGERPALLNETRAVELLEKELEIDQHVAEDLLLFLEQRTSLLRWRDDDEASGERRYEFPHRTLTEFLVAGRLAAEADGDQASTTLMRHADDADWREVALLYVCIIGSDADRPHEPVWALLRTLADQAGRDGRPWPERAARGRLAAECLAELRERLSVPDDVVELVDGLQPLFAAAETAEHLPAGERIAFWAAIGTHDRRLMKPEDRWVPVPGGRFWRGAAEDDGEADDEKPGAWIETSPFRIQRWPVTVAEFAEFVDGGGYRNRELWSPEGWSWRETEELERPHDWDAQLRRGGNVPVTWISWWEARAFARWLCDRTEDLRDGWEVRLPTEAEWEKAARGGELGADGQPDPGARRRYPWDGEFDADRANTAESRPLGLAPVGAHPGGNSPFGLWDASGNVWEWCADFFLPDAYERSDPEDPDPAVLDPALVSEREFPLWTPRGIKTVRARPRSIRGGGWGFGARNCRVSSRDGDAPGNRSDDLGFRCVAADPLILDI